MTNQRLRKMTIDRPELVTKRTYSWIATHPDANDGKPFKIYARCCNSSGAFLVGALGIESDFAAAHRRTESKHGWAAYMTWYGGRADGFKNYCAIKPTLKEVAFSIVGQRIALRKELVRASA